LGGDLFYFPYDGGAIGQFTGDTIRNFKSYLNIQNAHFPYLSGAFRAETTEDYTGSFTNLSDTSPSVAILDPSIVVPTANENRPASISSQTVITY